MGFHFLRLCELINEDGTPTEEYLKGRGGPPSESQEADEALSTFQGAAEEGVRIRAKEYENEEDDDPDRGDDDDEGVEYGDGEGQGKAFKIRRTKEQDEEKAFQAQTKAALDAEEGVAGIQAVINKFKTLYLWKATELSKEAKVALQSRATRIMNHIVQNIVGALACTVDCAGDPPVT